MWFLLGILAVSAVLCVSDIPALRRNGSRSEKFLFYILLVIGIGLNLAFSLGVKLPNPLVGWLILMKPIGKWIMDVFQLKP